MLTLPLVLFMVMSEIAVGAFTVMFALDWRNQIKRNFLVLYGIIYIAFAALTYLFQQGFANQALLNTYPALDKAWTGYLALPLLLFVLFMLPYNLFLWLDKNAGVDGKERRKALAKKPEGGEDETSVEPVRSGPSVVRILRLVAGSLVVLAGLGTILVLAMIFRPLEAANLGGAFTVASFFAAGLTLGGVMTAMWLGHWYLVTPALSEKPLQFATTLVLIGVMAEIILSFAAGPITAPSSHSTTTGASPTPTVVTQTGTPAPHSTVVVKPANIPVITPLGTGAIGWLHILVSFIIPLVLGALAWKLIRDRSFQSATGMLYLIVVCVIAGEVIARGLLLIGLA